MSEHHGTRSQRYAQRALERLMTYKKENAGNEKILSEYKARADGFPVMVMQAGLAQALGFMLAKGQGDTNAYGCYLDDLALVLLGKHGHARGEAGRNLHKEVIEADLTRYRRMTRDILMVAGWFKRFGQAYLGKTGMGERP
jgi:CRISPR-associated protein, Cmr5 family